MLTLNTIHQGNALDLLRQCADQSVHCSVTSPPYWNLRDYGTAPITWPAVTYSIFGLEIAVPELTCELGQEPDPKSYIGHMVLIFREVYRVLRDDGSLWLNIGDSYAGYWGEKYAHKPFGEDRTADASTPPNKPSPQFSKSKRGVKRYGGGNIRVSRDSFLKPKDLIGIPWMLAFALRDDGWYLRSGIIWFKRNPMPESVIDRPTKAHEDIFLLTKSERYYYDHHAIKTEPKGESNKIKMPDGWDTGPGSHGSIHRNGREKGKTSMKDVGQGQANIRKFRDTQRGIFHGGNPRPSDTKGGNQGRAFPGRTPRPDDDRGGNQGSTNGIPREGMTMGANKRTVWDIPTMPFKEAHFATFPEDLPATCIKAGTSRQCCADCGAPYERVVVPSDDYAAVLGTSYHDHQNDQEQGMKQVRGDNPQNKMRDAGVIAPEFQTTGWQKTCKCETTSTRPAVVLEPFSGAGTVPLVARKLGRDFLAMELKAEYIAISENRLSSELGMFK